MLSVLKPITGFTWLFQLSDMKLIFLGRLRHAAVLTVVLVSPLILFSDALYSLGMALIVWGHDSFYNFWVRAVVT